jgi:DNA-binding transcriptional regulator YdaS (Cro superfamily)
MQNLLKVAIVAAGGGKAVAQMLGVTPVTVSRWVSGLNPFPIEHVRKLCDAGGIIDPARLSIWLADREAERARAKFIARAA